MAFRLKFCRQRSIRDEQVKLTEPSGVALSRGGQGFWIVSDNAKKLFHTDLDGQVDPDRTFGLEDKGLEGLTSHSNEDVLFAVREQSNEVIKLDLRTKTVTNRRRLADMVGYDSLAKFFDPGEENKGLEGLTWNDDTGTLFCLKEGKPGLLMELTPDFMTVRLRAKLDKDNGFTNPEKNGDKPDFSGISYDRTRTAFWIASDQAERLYLYDALADAVLNHEPLIYRENGEKKRVKKAEGVVCDPDSDRLYIVTDRKKGDQKKDVKLFTYEVQA